MTVKFQTRKNSDKLEIQEIFRKKRKVNSRDETWEIKTEI